VCVCVHRVNPLIARPRLRSRLNELAPLDTVRGYLAFARYCHHQYCMVYIAILRVE